MRCFVSLPFLVVVVTFIGKVPWTEGRHWDRDKVGERTRDYKYGPPLVFIGYYIKSEQYRTRTTTGKINPTWIMKIRLPL